MTEQKYVVDRKDIKGLDATKKDSSVDLIEFKRFDNLTYNNLIIGSVSNNEIQEDKSIVDNVLRSSEKKAKSIGRNVCAKRALIAAAVIVFVLGAVAIAVYFTVFYKADSDAAPDKTTAASTVGRSAATTGESTRMSSVTPTSHTVLSTDKTTASSTVGRSNATTEQSTRLSSVTPTSHTVLSTDKTTAVSTVGHSSATTEESTRLSSVTPTSHTVLSTDTKRRPTQTSTWTTTPETASSTEIVTIYSTTRNSVLTTTAETTTTTTLPESTEWTSWGSWTTCSVTCGSGVHMRYRKCHKGDSLNNECVGDYVKQEVCSAPACPVNGKWTLWSPWDTCDVTCGGGVQSRTRTCKKSSNTNIDCVGDTTQQQSCSDWHCPDCSKTCLVGTLNEACDTCICESTTVEGRVLSSAGNPISDAILSADTAPTRILAESNSTGYFTLTATCVTSSILFSRSGFQDKVVEVSTTFQVIEMELEVLPRITEQPRSKFRLAGEDVIMCCSAISSPNITYYEWFHDAILLSKSLYQNNGTSINISAVKPTDSGKYTCRANSQRRAIISAPAQLTVKGHEDDFCKDALQQKKRSLPSNCIQPVTNATAYEVGYCLSKGCRKAGANETEVCNENSKSCCVPSRLETKTVNCTDYELQVIVVKECECGSCDAASITILGKAVDAISGSPLQYGEVWLNGEFVSYTNVFGSFSVSLSNHLSKAILTVKDTYNGAFLDAIKVIDITESLSGSISITIPMLRSASPVLIESDVETVLSTDPNHNDSVSDMAQISIPANSFYRKDGTKFSGKVSSRLTFLNPTDTDTEGNVPGRFQFIDEEGSSTNLASKGVFNLQFQDENGVPLIVDDVIDVSFPENNDLNFTLWKLSKETGVWEPLMLGIKSKRRKRRRTEGLIGEIDMSQIESNSWLNLDKPGPVSEFSDIFDNICFFKIRVYKDENLSEELIRTSGFIMEFHSKEDNTLTSYSRDTSFPAQTCFPASCQNNMGYIRFFYSANSFYEDLKDLIATEPVSANFALDYELLDGNQTFRAKMSANANGPFYEDLAVCEASGIRDNHLRFRIMETKNEYIVQEVTPLNSAMSIDELKIIQQKVWYPFRKNEYYNACFIKIKFDVQTKFTNPSETNMKFHVISQGDKIADKVNFIFGVKEFTVDVSSTSSFHCIEYKCSGELEGSADTDYTRIKVGLLTPSSYSCHTHDIQTNLKEYSFGVYGQRNRYRNYFNYFDAYAPAVYRANYGIYEDITDNLQDPAAGREAARQRIKDDCMKTQPILNEGAAFRFHCT